MNDADLDRCYTALANALAEVGEERASMLLSMLVLALVARQDDPDEVLRLIANARQRSDS